MFVGIFPLRILFALGNGWMTGKKREKERELGLSEKERETEEEEEEKVSPFAATNKKWLGDFDDCGSSAAAPFFARLLQLR